MIYNIWCIVFLIICTIMDLKQRKIYVAFCAANVVGAMVIHICLKDIQPLSIIVAIIIGGIFFAISIVTKDAIGSGDAVIILTVGILLGGNAGFEVVTWSFLICAILSTVQIVIRKRNLKSEIAFAPFLLAGGIIVVMQGGII